MSYFSIDELLYIIIGLNLPMQFSLIKLARQQYIADPGFCMHVRAIGGQRKEILIMPPLEVDHPFWGEVCTAASTLNSVRSVCKEEPSLFRTNFPIATE